MLQSPASQSSGVLALVHHDTAIENDLLDAHRELLGLLEGGGRFHGIGVEYYDVSSDDDHIVFHTVAPCAKKICEL